MDIPAFSGGAFGDAIVPLLKTSLKLARLSRLFRAWAPTLSKISLQTTFIRRAQDLTAFGYAPVIPILTSD